MSTHRWRSWSTGQRAAFVVVVSVFAVNVVMLGARRLIGSGPRGEPSSSYATAGDGVAAYADLLARRGHGVERARTTLDRTRLDPDATLMLLDPKHLEDQEPEAIRAFLEGGGRLVAAGRGTAPALRHVLGQGVVWSPRGIHTARPVAPVAEVRGLSEVRTGAQGSWEDVGPALPVLAGGGRVLAAVASVRDGRLVLVADASVLQNRFLAAHDNAAFGLAAAGPSGRPVIFAEAAHGYTQGEGLAAIPSRWKLALGGAALAVVLWMWSRGRRFGPPEDRYRSLPPPRRAYVDAVAATLSRTRQPEASLEPLRQATRRRLAQRAGISPDADPETLAEAARRVGVPADAVGALVAPVTSEQDVMALGRAAASVQGSLMMSDRPR